MLFHRKESNLETVSRTQVSQTRCVRSGLKMKVDTRDWWIVIPSLLAAEASPALDMSELSMARLSASDRFS